MDIAHISGFNSFPPSSGGAVHVHQITTHFIKKGHVVHCFNYDQNPNTIKYPWTWGGIRKLYKNVDIVYIRLDGQYHNEKLNIYKLINRFNVPTVWEVNAPLEEMLAYPTNHNTLRNIHLSCKNLKRGLLARYTNCAVCVSKEMQSYSLNFLNIKKSYLVPNGSDPEMFTPQKKNESLFTGYEDYFKVLWAGSARYPWQGLDLLQKLTKEFKEGKVLFVIITNKNDLKIKFGKNTMIIDEIPYLQISEYFASVDAGLCIYHDFNWSKWDFHFSPLKLFDYMSSGIPVIASGLGQIKDVIKHGQNGLLTNNEIKDITKNILYLMNNQDEAKKIGRNARQSIIEFYNWDRTTEDILKIIKKLVY